MTKREEWLADTCQKVGLGLFLGAFLKAGGVFESALFLIGGLGMLSASYWLTSGDAEPK